MNGLERRLANFSPDEREAAARFPMRLPGALVRRIDWEGDGPLIRQFLPRGEELILHPGDALDPLGEEAAAVAPGLIRKYPGRVLLRVGSRCAVHCRFCFRRHASRESLPETLRAWAPALAEIARDPTLGEAILSGGDPLMRSDRHLAALTRALAAIPHLRRLRIHSRMPVVTPKRVNAALLAWLTGTRLTPVMVVHVNHAGELEQKALAALGRLVGAGVPVLSQSVLLRGVNDDVQTLAALFERLVDARVMPYYLHMLDPVAGAAHFRVEEERALELLAGLRGRLPGYAVPRLAREVPGEAGKRVL